MKWWTLGTLAGVAVWPLVFRLLRRLPDRGYTVARPVGMLLTGYVFWLLGSLGFFRNTVGCIALSWLIVLGLAVGVYVSWRDREEMLTWLRRYWRLVLVSELVFAVLFIGWAVVRAYDPNLAGTEKPMEMAFLNAIRRSRSFPPNDPWMSGYAISYYYFGYVMMSMLAKTSGVVSGVAFNLMIAFLMGLAGTGAFGVVFNLVHSARMRRAGAEAIAMGPSLTFALLGPLFVVIVGNLEGVVELLYANRLMPPGFWQWLDLEGMEQLPEISHPDLMHWRYMWWWRASRVIRDLDLNGNPIGLQPIDEFPFFSYLLGDLHPHVLAFPFAVLGVTLALNLALWGDSAPRIRGRVVTVFYALVLGGLIFLNAWDGPIYIALVTAAELLRRLLLSDGELTLHDVREAIIWGVTVGLLGGLLYLPFYIGFRSQASGFLPNLIHLTRLHQFVLMFGFPLVMIGFFLALELRRGAFNWETALPLVAGAVGFMMAAAMALGLLAYFRPEVQTQLQIAISEAGGLGAALEKLLVRRLTFSLTTLVLSAVLVIALARLLGHHRAEGVDLGTWQIPVTLAAVLASGVLGYLFYELTRAIVRAIARMRKGIGRGTKVPRPYSPEVGFVLVLIMGGAALTLVPEFVYLRDNFGARLNTIFKFYYQAWLMWNLAGAYIVYEMVGKGEARFRGLRMAFVPVFVVLLAASLIYPVAGVLSETRMFSGPPYLDGGPTMFAGRSDYRAALCLAAFEPGDDAVVAEAIGGQYSNYARVSTVTGIPTVLGWPGHEGQWRGATYGQIAGSRETDIRYLYESPDWESAREVVDRYGIDYIFVGSLEMGDFPRSGLAKFDLLVERGEAIRICEGEDVVVYYLIGEVGR